MPSNTNTEENLTMDGSSTFGRSLTETEFSVVNNMYESLEDVKNETLKVLSDILYQLFDHYAGSTKDIELINLVNKFKIHNSNSSVYSNDTNKTVKSDEDNILIVKENNAKAFESQVTLGDNLKYDKKLSFKSSGDAKIDDVKRQAEENPMCSGIVDALEESVTNRKMTESFLKKYTTLSEMSTVSQKYILALSLASLCNAIYQLLSMQNYAKVTTEKKGSKDYSLKNSNDLIIGDDKIFTNKLVEKLSVLEHHSLKVENSLSPDELNIWVEVQFLLSFVQESIRLLNGGNTSTAKTESKVGSNELLTLSPVINAIERVYKVAPHLMDQTFILSKEQELRIEAIVVWKLINRLNKGMEAFDDQRATLVNRRETLNKVIEQLSESAQRRLNDQRAALSEGKVLELESARLGERMEQLTKKTRMYDQDYVSKESQRLDDLQNMHKLFNRVLDSSSSQAFDSQRYVPSSTKEKNMYLNSLGARVDRAERLRLTDQDADWISPQERRERSFDEVASAIDRLQPQFVDQRATFPIRRKQ